MTSATKSNSSASATARSRAGAHVFEFSDDLLGSSNRDGYFTALNPAWEKTLGFPRETLMGKPIIDFIHPSDRAAAVAEQARLESEGVVTTAFENRFAVEAGGWCWLSWQVEVCEEGYYFVAHDVTRQTAADHRQHLRASIVEGVDDAVMTKTTDCVITSWNRASEELYGYSASEAIGKSVIDLLVPPELAEEPERIVERLLAGEGVRQYTTQRRHEDGTPLTISLTASLLRDVDHEVVGVAVVSRDISQIDLDRDPQVRGDLDNLAWVGRIRDAIDEDRIGFYTQPIVNLAGAPNSYELLCRMFDRNGEVISPGRFLPAAENYGQITELDLLAIDEGARLIARGHRVNINLSTASVARRHIVDVLGDRLRDAQADPSFMTFEITETALMRDTIAAERFAAGAAALGCRISLDDFGTGFGGFTYLKKMQIHQLKIDVEFVRDLPSNRASQHVVKAVVSLAKGLGLETVAEGVEDEATLELLREYGISHVQGYFIAKPSPLATTLAGPDGPTRTGGAE